MHNKSYIQAIADALAAETISRAMLLRAQSSLKGKELSRIDAINAALEQMVEGMEGNGNECK